MTDRRRFLKGVGTVALTVAVAGCSDSSDGGDTPAEDGDTGTSEQGMADTPTPEGDETAAEQTPEGEATEGGSTEAVSLELPTYEFSEGESYTYDVNFAGTETEETWTVTAVDGDEVTVERLSTVDGETRSQTVSGTHDGIYDTVAESRDVNFFPLARNAVVYAQETGVTTGDTFTVATPSEKTDWDSETVEVLGETTVNGVSATEFRVTPDGPDAPNQVTTVALADGYPFALSLSFSQDDSALLEMTLTDATRP